MTLIAVACNGDHAEFLADTTSYLPNARDFTEVTKFTVLPHIDAVALAAGPGPFIHGAKWLVGCGADDADGLLKALPEDLEGVWRDQGLSDDMPGNLIFVAYSPSRGRFAAHRFSSLDGFAPHEIDALHVQPHLWTSGPMGDAAGRAQAAETRHYATKDLSESDAAQIVPLLDRWEARPPSTSVPASVTEWAELALQVRDERALNGPWGRAFIAGQLMYGRLERGSVTVVKIFDFYDQGEEFEQMVTYTDHPTAQLGVCWCGSGRSILTCCRAGDLDKPCKCGTSDALFKDCCLTAEAAVIAFRDRGAV